MKPLRGKPIGYASVIYVLEDDVNFIISIPAMKILPGIIRIICVLYSVTCT